MGEIKSVKVDNWGVFFLQKLQNFFNKTDYCDLTLQFNDNSQLKVHKLVLNACTDYFNVLEQTCEMIDDVLIMPNELQADLVVPIVNFMYTGTLEFELKIYGKLLKTARDMNMTVLLKLLEAHRRTMEGGNKGRNQKATPRTVFPPSKATTKTNQGAGRTNAAKQVKQGRHAIGNSEAVYRSLQIKPVSTTTYKTPGTIFTKVQTTPIKGPTRFDYDGSETILQSNFDTTFDTISYESKPLKDEYDDHQQQTLIYTSQETSPFEQLRQTGYNNNKRPASSLLESPPAKKPNIQDVKEYAEQQRMRKQIAEEYGEEPEFESILDDEFHNNDDDEEYLPQKALKPAITRQSQVQLQSQPQQQTSNVKKTGPKIIQQGSQQKPTIVVKDSSSSNVDHAKIISEVLRKYPHLIKDNKNIKLKIMPNTSGVGGSQKVVIKKEPEDRANPYIKSEPFSPVKKAQATQIQQIITAPTITTQQQLPQSVPSNQPRRIDSKTMKQLIALGAENTTGPWLCLRCGVNGRPISIPSYRGFRRHLINTHKEKIDPRLCEYCGWRSINQKELAFHMHTQHEIRTSINFPKCEHCGVIVFDLFALDVHIDDVHPEVKEDNQQCIYCNKTFSTELMLYNHMKDQHKERARDDGVIDFSEEDEAYEEYEQQHQMPNTRTREKIQILSDINLPKCISLTQIPKVEPGTIVNLPLSSESVGLNNLASGITSSISLIDNGNTIDSELIQESTEPKFINAEGNIMELTQAQRDEIMSQLEQGGDGVVMVLDESFNTTTVVNKVNLEDVNNQTSQAPINEHIDDNVLLMYGDNEETKEDNEGRESAADENINESLDKNDSANESMDWKSQDEESQEENDNEEFDNKKDHHDSNENLDEQLKKLTEFKSCEEKVKATEKELDEKLKMLTHDWTDDEDDEQEENAENSSKDNKDEDKEMHKEKDDNPDEGVLLSKSEEKTITSKPIETTADEKDEEPKELKDVNEEEELSKEVKEEVEEDELKEMSGEHEIDEEDLSREQPICASEDEILFETDLIKVPTSTHEIKETDPEDEKVTKEQTLKDENNSKDENKEKEDEKEEENEEESSGKELNIDTKNDDEDDDENKVKKQPENKSEDPVEKEKEIKSISSEEKKDALSDNDEDVEDGAPQNKKKEGIKSLISEWGEEDDDL